MKRSYLPCDTVSSKYFLYTFSAAVHEASFMNYSIRQKHNKVFSKIDSLRVDVA